MCLSTPHIIISSLHPFTVIIHNYLATSCPKFSQNNNSTNTSGGSVSDTRVYRTNSHFGLPIPNFTNPMQFHVPIVPTKYVPLRRSRSLQEVFAGKYEKLLDRTPLTLPFAGKYFRARQRPIRQSFYEVQEEEDAAAAAAEKEDLISFEKFKANFEVSKVDLEVVHNDFLKVFDEKLLTEKPKLTKPGSFLEKIDGMNFTKPAVANNPSTIEETILNKISHGNLDRSEGSIFHKIEEELKTRKDRINELIAPEKNDEPVKPPATPISTPTKQSVPMSKSSTPVSQEKKKPKNDAKKKITTQSSAKAIVPNCSKSTPNLQKSAKNVTLRRPAKITNTNNNLSQKPKSSPVLSFEKKSNSNSSSLWLPFVQDPVTPSTSAPSINSAFERDCDSSDEITLCIDNQYVHMKELGECTKRMQNDMEEIMEIHNNSLNRSMSE